MKGTDLMPESLHIVRQSAVAAKVRAEHKACFSTPGHTALYRACSAHRETSKRRTVTLMNHCFWKEHTHTHTHTHTHHSETP